jgi:D-psicose/D-tagatose/L-ribulose 3-epimerase
MQSLRYAVHAFAWTTRWSNDSLHLIDHAKALGFDLIEIPLMDLDLVDVVRIRERAETVGIGLCTSTACSSFTDPTSDDAHVRQQAIHYLKQCVEATAEMGAKTFSGVIYSAIGGRIAGFPTQEHWDRAAAALNETAQRGQELGITLGIEPINRYETFLINTCDQALRLREMTGQPNVAVHLDAYHMNIEETDFYTPTKAAAPYLCHYHLSESHRGTPGTGTVDWHGIYRALAEAGYNGVVGLESFCQVSPSMAAATCIWRELAPSSDQLLTDGLKFLKGLEREHKG